MGVSITHCLIKAAGLALREFPQMRAKLQGQEFLILSRGTRIGLITAVEGGLVVPVIRDADQLSLTEIADKVRALVENARAGKLSAGDASGAAFSITNLACTMWRPFTPSFTRPNPPSSPSVRSWRSRW